MEKIEIKNLSVSIKEKLILNNLNLEIPKGKITVLLGPNGAGKSTVSNILMGNPKYIINAGEIFLNGEKINELSPQDRAKRGLFMSFQYPCEILGVTMMNFLRTSYNSIKSKNLNAVDFQKILKEKMEILKMDSKFRTRFVNDGFSGGEKKKSEILQLLLFEPQYAILDEIDSGLDVDALKVISVALKELQNKTNCSLLIITHYNKILEYLEPNLVYIMENGKIIEKGDKSLAEKIQKKGFSKNEL